VLRNTMTNSFRHLVWLGALGCAAASDDIESASQNPDSPTANLTLELTIPRDDSAADTLALGSILDIALGQDGSLWILDGGYSRGQTRFPALRMFDSTGTFLRAVGREGAGPGEYEMPFSLATLKDGRVALRDRAVPTAITLYRADGSLDQRLPLGQSLNYLATTGGVLVDTGGVIWLPVLAGRPGPAPRRRYFHRVHPDGTPMPPVDPPAVPPRSPSVSVTTVTASGGTSVRGLTVPFQPSVDWVWRPTGGFAVVNSARYEIELRSPTDAERTVATVTRSTPPIHLGREEARARQEELEREAARIFNGTRVNLPAIPGSKPPIKRATYSDDGQLLVYAAVPSVLRDGEWHEPTAVDVFSPSGEFRGRIMLPDSFSVYRMKGDRLVGVQHHDDGSESVRVFRVSWQ
jgi:hypothetical protein